VSVNVSPRHFRSTTSRCGCSGCCAPPVRTRRGCGSRSPRSRCSTTRRAHCGPRLLRDYGVLAQLDDFGTGFSALSYLHRFPIEALKIDQSFVAGLRGESRPESLAVIRAILALAGTLGIDTIGEGIEHPAQREALLEMGCVYGQGYLFGRPEACSVVQR
jgi:EAL domain-containing protein (putative c-di-GMP-specific phosphodiesterase class I)